MSPEGPWFNIRLYSGDFTYNFIVLISSILIEAQKIKSENNGKI